MTATRDPCSLSNYGAWRTKHTSVDFKIDFDVKQIHGSVVLQLESQTDKESEEVILDSNSVKISDVRVNDVEAKWEIKDHSDPFGAPLHVTVPGGVSKGEVIHIKIHVQTTDKCPALQWLSPAQTSNGKHPYIFSQAYPINARSIFPCQDSPDVKSTFSFRLTSKLPVVASGLYVGDRDHTATLGTEKVYEFEQKIPIPSYLFAVASGDIATARIGPRSIVATGPNELAACKWELENDIEKFLQAAEKLVFPYRWGEYNVLILPPSFPFGGESLFYID
jgi:leukotriene-A4 hydrolase